MEIGFSTMTKKFRLFAGSALLAGVMISLNGCISSYDDSNEEVAINNTLYAKSQNTTSNLDVRRARAEKLRKHRERKTREDARKTEERRRVADRKAKDKLGRERAAERRRVANTRRKLRQQGLTVIECYTGRTDNFGEMAAWHRATKKNGASAEIAIKIPPIETEFATGGGC